MEYIQLILQVILLLVLAKMAISDHQLLKRLKRK